MSTSGPSGTQPAPTLYALRGDRAGQTFEVKHDQTLIGRSSTCDVLLSKRSVSRQHARIVHHEGGYYLEDLESDSGTKVDGRRVDGRVTLADCSLIEISRNLFVFNNPSFRIGDDEGSSRILGMLDVSSSGDATGPGVRSREKLHHVLEISRNLGDTLHLDGILRKTLDALFEIFPQADGGFVVLEEDKVMDDAPRAFKFRGDRHGDLCVSRSVFHYVMRQGQAILSLDLLNDSRFRESESVARSPVRTLMCVPLLDHERNPAGILQIDTRSDHARFSQDDLDLLAAVAVLVGVAVENAKLHAALIHQTQTEQETADVREVQKALLPARRPELTGYAFWDFYEPARSVGGDYFDYLPIAPTDGNTLRWAIAVGDVAGKGMPAALLMARLSAEVRLHVLSGSEPGAVVTRLNEDLVRAGIEGRFITFVLVLIDGESHTMTVVCAGHMGPVIHRASGEIETFGEDVGGTPLGIDARCPYSAAVTTLDRGDRVVVYTDGVTDAIDAAGQCFTLDRLHRTIRQTPGTIDELGTEIIQAVRRHCGDHPQADDITLLCIGRL